VKLAGEFYSILLEQKEQTKDLDRDAIKDDCKLIAQVFNRKIEGYITKDRKSFSSIIKPITDVSGFTIKLIDLSTSLKDYKGELF
jgi:site-specific recombinase